MSDPLIDCYVDENGDKEVKSVVQITLNPLKSGHFTFRIRIIFSPAKRGSNVAESTSIRLVALKRLSRMNCKSMDESQSLSMKKAPLCICPCSTPERTNSTFGVRSWASSWFSPSSFGGADRIPPSATSRILVCTGKKIWITNSWTGQIKRPWITEAWMLFSRFGCKKRGVDDVDEESSQDNTDKR